MPFLFQRLNAVLHGIEIHYRAEIGDDFAVLHSQGIVIGERVKIGDHCAVYSSAVLGVRHRGVNLHPVIGNHVLIGSGAKILGDVTVGDHVFIGANAVVLSDVPPHCTVAGIPARVVKSSPQSV
ncbi:MAG: hypothetical protein A2Z83_00925 [Omnitrophica bacterium GWA2_52_8]|nr:MAG: hypothetical protein A2Z83_00925 [Omnitrophica bacterium GWA2_52_8]